MGFRSPVPLLGAAAALVFLFSEENPIWGGTIASTLTGEFSYTYGIGLAVLFLGVTYRAYARGDGPWVPAAVLAAHRARPRLRGPVGRAVRVLLPVCLAPPGAHAGVARRRGRPRLRAVRVLARSPS